MSPPTKTHCKRGHPLNGSNLYTWYDKTGKRFRLCQQCNRIRKQKYRKNPESKTRHRAWFLKTNYNLTPEQYQQMYAAQRGKCTLPSCNRPIDAIDHDHATGLVRGLMCRQHNAALGLFHDNPILLREAADYLERFEP